MNWLRLIAVIIAVALLWKAADYLLHIEEHRLQGAIRETIAAFANQDFAKLQMRIADNVNFSSPEQQIGSGDKQDLESRVQRFWEKATDISVLDYIAEIKIENNKGQLALYGLLYFTTRQSEYKMAYKFNASLQCEKLNAQWRITHITVEKLRLGVF